MKQYGDSAGMFEKAVALNPNDSEVVVNLADAYRWSGQQDKAQSTYQQAISLGYKELEINPQNASAMAQMALSYAKTGEAQQADNFIRRARNIDKSNVNYIYFEAEIDAILNRPTVALKALREAFEKHFPVEFAAGDPELENVQKNPEFAALLKQYAEKKSRHGPKRLDP
ncbi:MAG: tetratricopeptide repeat protein [Candidatus Acidiferrales bacterium]